MTEQKYEHISYGPLSSGGIGVRECSESEMALSKEDMALEALIKIASEVKGYMQFTKERPVVDVTLFYVDKALEACGWVYVAPDSGLGLPKYKKIDAQTPNS